MSFKAISLDLKDAQNLMCAVVVRRLRDLKWSPEEIERIADRAIRNIERRLEDSEVLESVAADAAMMCQGGASDKAIATMANATFAILGMKVADDVHASRVAEFN